MKRMLVNISGIVQGVFFRAETEKTARSLNLTGWVRNKEDGGVEALFEGDDKDMEKMIAWCRQGPPRARVDRVTIEEQPYTGELKGFRIVYL